MLLVVRPKIIYTIKSLTLIAIDSSYNCTNTRAHKCSPPKYLFNFNISHKHSFCERVFDVSCGLTAFAVTFDVYVWMMLIFWISKPLILHRKRNKRKQHRQLFACWICISNRFGYFWQRCVSEAYMPCFVHTHAVRRPFSPFDVQHRSFRAKSNIKLWAE